jgi:ELWxxDGT repeat protein
MTYRRFFSGLLGILVSLGVGEGLASAQPAHLVKDINTTKARTLGARQLSPAVPLGGGVLFVGDDGGTGLELWRYDLSTGGTSLVRDICPGSCSSFPYLPIVDGNRIFFAADDGTHGLEIWRSDGTTAGTVRVTDLDPGTVRSFGNWLDRIGGEIFFAGRDRTHGYELWALDTATLQTRQVADIAQGPASSLPELIAAGGGRILFRASSQLWITDGTAGGTHQVIDSLAPQVDVFDPIATAGIQLPDGSFLFSAADGVHAVELWRTDGTQAGTSLVQDINPTGDSSPSGFISFQGKTYFGATSATATGLWVTDGTSSGTALVKETGLAQSSKIPGLFTIFGNQLFFVDNPDFGGRLWKTDGTAAGTVALDTGAFALAPAGGSLFALSGDLFFGSGLSLLKTDGTDAGTVELKNVGLQSPVCLFGAPLSAAGGLVFFNDCNAEAGQQFWRSDGTAAGTVTALSPTLTPSFPYLELPASGPETFLKSLGTGLVFRADDSAPGVEVWKTDGTAAGTSLQQTSLATSDHWRWLPFQNDPLFRLNGTMLYASPTPEEALLAIRNGPAAPETLVSSGMGDFVRFWSLGNLALFNHSTGTGTELWKTDGTAAGTGQVAPQTGEILGSAGSRLFLRINGDEIWKTDGTSPGTVLVKDLALGSNSQAYGWTPTRNLLFFILHDEAAGTETLWRTDGTDAGTLAVQSFPWPSAGPSGSNITSGLYSIGDRVLFVADDGVHGHEIWASDGSPGGTHLARDVSPGAASFTETLDRGVAVGGRLFFLADDGMHGYELWISDGTETGTHLVKDVRPGVADSQGSFPTMVVVRGRLFFLADDGVHGFELWVSDGTDAGTHLVKDILAGQAGTLISQLTAVGNDLVFSASDGTHGGEPWTSDGTDAGTYMIQDIAPGSKSSGPLKFTSASSLLYFLADDGTTGLELWTAPRSALPPTFTDVPGSHWAWAAVEALVANGVTGGCGGGQYCPDTLITRDQMAVLLSAARRGPTPPPATGTRFQDVPADYWAAPWIEQLAAEGIVGGCSVSPPLYCPTASLTRAQMAVLLVGARHETPAAPTGTRFGDVPADYWAAPWIERLAADGITGGCGGGDFCPERPVTRAEMAVFLTTSFGLTLP